MEKSSHQSLRKSLAQVIRTARKLKHFTQEDFALISSRTYLSSLERGLKSPTIDKLEEIAGVLGTSPATLLLAAELIQGDSNFEELATTLTDSAKQLANEA